MDRGAVVHRAAAGDVRELDHFQYQLFFLNFVGAGFRPARVLHEKSGSARESSSTKVHIRVN